jgi:hypothetical protein
MLIVGEWRPSNKSRARFSIEVVNDPVVVIKIGLLLDFGVLFLRRPCGRAQNGSLLIEVEYASRQTEMGTLAEINVGKVTEVDLTRLKSSSRLYSRTAYL